MKLGTTWNVSHGKRSKSTEQLFMSIISATQEAETSRIKIQGQKNLDISFTRDRVLLPFTSKGLFCTKFLFLTNENADRGNLAPR
jgi:hypothetical protein